VAKAVSSNIEHLVDTVRKLAEAGKLDKEIADIYQVSRSAVGKLRSRHGIRGGKELRESGTPPMHPAELAYLRRMVNAGSDRGPSRGFCRVCRTHHPLVGGGRVGEHYFEGRPCWGSGRPSVDIDRDGSRWAVESEGASK
jgi:hypothetical protein